MISKIILYYFTVIARELSKTRIQHLLSTYSVPDRLLSVEESKLNQEIKEIEM